MAHYFSIKFWTDASDVCTDYTAADYHNFIKVAELKTVRIVYNILFIYIL